MLCVYFNTSVTSIAPDRMTIICIPVWRGDDIYKARRIAQFCGGKICTASGEIIYNAVSNHP